MGGEAFSSSARVSYCLGVSTWARIVEKTYNQQFGYPKSSGRRLTGRVESPGPGSRLPPVSEPRDLVVEQPVEDEEDVEVVDAVPVLAGPRSVQARPAGQVVAQAAAVAVTSFAAGAVATAVVRHARAGRRAARRRKEVRGLEVVASRTFLVDVHLLGGRE
jgi:hypothetical protein